MVMAVGAFLLATRCAVSFNDYPVGDLDASVSGGSANGGSAGSDASSGGSSANGGLGGTGTGGSAGTDGSAGTGGASGSGGVGGTAGGSGSGGSGGATNVPPSCQTSGPGLDDCGPKSESCCTSLPVPGGTFFRSYDDVTFTDQSYPATVSAFRLDKYEITVGRFRKFVAVWDKGWRPAQGDGKHAYVNGGKGLADSSNPGSYETGWTKTWSANLATTSGGWDTNLQCDAKYQTWTPGVTTHENHPINCVTWYEAYAFCIWDGGFLPTEAEWNFAAAGGSEQRQYPWGSAPPDCSYANFKGASGGTDFCVLPGTGSMNDVGSESPKGDGKFGQADLSGNAWEWTLDWYSSPYVVQCIDCAYLSSTSDHEVRGGSFDNTPLYLQSAYRPAFAPSRSYGRGARCARAP